MVVRQQRTPGSSDGSRASAARAVRGRRGSEGSVSSSAGRAPGPPTGRPSQPCRHAELARASLARSRAANFFDPVVPTWPEHGSQYALPPRVLDEVVAPRSREAWPSLEGFLRECELSTGPLVGERHHGSDISFARARPSRSRTRGLYVLRRDISARRVDPVRSRPPCGPLMEEALAVAGTSAGPDQLAWLRGAFRPPLAAVDSNSAVQIPERGIPTGSALQPGACNLYLTPLDRLAESIPGAFYARYGDDVVFAVADPRLALHMQHSIDEFDPLARAHSQSGQSAAYYLTSAGLAPSDAPGFAAAQGSRTSASR